MKCRLQKYSINRVLLRLGISSNIKTNEKTLPILNNS